MYRDEILARASRRNELGQYRSDEVLDAELRRALIEQVQQTRVHIPDRWRHTFTYAMGEPVNIGHTDIGEQREMRATVAWGPDDSDDA